jgi:hypothetical protein
MTWETDELREHLTSLIKSLERSVDQRFSAQEKSVTQAFHAAQRATDRADAAASKRFEGVNEFRQAMEDQQRTFIPRAEVEARLTPLERFISTNSAKSRGITEGWSWSVAIIAIVVAVISLFR